MRDRLIDMIQDSVNGCARHWAEIIADYLLDNGVTVPPCKIGDDIWVSTITRDEVYKTKAIGFIYDVVTSPYNVISFDEVYTSKEEAEKALQGGVQE